MQARRFFIDGYAHVLIEFRMKALTHAFARAAVVPWVMPDQHCSIYCVSVVDVVMQLIITNVSLNICAHGTRCCSNCLSCQCVCDHDNAHALRVAVLVLCSSYSHAQLTACTILRAPSEMLPSAVKVTTCEVSSFFEVLYCLSPLCSYLERPLSLASADHPWPP